MTRKNPMSNEIKNFGGTASSLARNPLGIIALFIVLVYGLASLVTAFAGSLTPAERVPLVYFLIGFPILVLGVFAWLVSKHNGKLFAPSDFKNEENYVKMQMEVVASLAAATSKSDTPTSEAQLHSIVHTVRATAPIAVPTAGWRNRVLWVDDRPENNVFERQALEALGLRFSLATTTSDALEILATTKFTVIISDMGRKEGPREGYVLLDELRSKGDGTPLFFYASSNAPEHKREAREHGGQGCTNNAQELFEMVTGAVIRRQSE